MLISWAQVMLVPDIHTLVPTFNFTTWFNPLVLGVVATEAGYWRSHISPFHPWRGEVELANMDPFTVTTIKSIHHLQGGKVEKTKLVYSLCSPFVWLQVAYSWSLGFLRSPKECSKEPSRWHDCGFMLYQGGRSRLERNTSRSQLLLRVLRRGDKKYSFE